MQREDEDCTTLNREALAGGDMPEPSARMCVVFYHRDGVSAVELHEGATLTVGRSAPSDVQIADPSLSRMHAQLELRDGVLSVSDLGSTNGTQVAGIAVQKAELRPGDELTLGDARGAAHWIGPSQSLPSSIDSYDALLARVHDEAQRAHAFARTFALVVLRATAQPAQHFGRWLSAVQGVLRPVDRIGAYDAAALLVLMPEIAAEQACNAAGRAIDAAGPGAALAGAVAMFPSSASSVEKLLGSLRQACPRAGGRAPVVVADEQPDERDAARIVVHSPRMHALYQMVGQIAAKGIGVLLVGETGSGKEVVAAALHRQSGRPGPLRAVNCATIPQSLTESVLFGHERGAFSGAVQRAKGVFEDADGGSLLLDEIGELSAQAQAALLRVLQTGRFTRVGGTREIAVDVRIIAATHRDLEDMVEQGMFREDLLYRVNAVTLRLPPLRERAEEIDALAESFLRDAAAQWGSNAVGFSSAALDVLRAYPWPGNVRELRNIVERAAALCSRPVIGPEDLGERLWRAPSPSEVAPEPTPNAEPQSLREQVRAYEAKLIVEALRACDGNVTKAAARLQIPVRTLGYRIRSYGIDIGDIDG